ncbi:MAG: penicillin-binding protein, partial [Actinophytocola sp.]|nr:penicillin-binding protein [Actinophytocola sp.]
QGSGDSWGVAAVDAKGRRKKVLHGKTLEKSAALTTTLSASAQASAQAAVDSVGNASALVVIRPSTGDIIAVAQNRAAGESPVALTGLYPPGSTFKIATATAVLDSGAAGIGTVLPCPGKATIGTRTIPNDGGFDLGDVPLRTAFAHSCNTTFGRLAAELPADALAKAADALGLNADFDVPGITTEAGAVLPADSQVQRVEDGIGQGRVQASPFGVALMAATVAAGKQVKPRLWRDIDTIVNEGYRPPSAAVLAFAAFVADAGSSKPAVAVAGKFLGG